MIRPHHVLKMCVERSTLNSGVTSEICGNMATRSDAPTSAFLPRNRRREMA
jgi:hypothetical protein